MKKTIIVFSIISLLVSIPTALYAHGVEKYVVYDNTYSWQRYYGSPRDSYHHYSHSPHQKYRHYAYQRGAKQYRINKKKLSYTPIRTVTINYDPIRYRPLGGYRYYSSSPNHPHLRYSNALHPHQGGKRGRVIYSHCGY